MKMCIVYPSCFIKLFHKLFTDSQIVPLKDMKIKHVSLLQGMRIWNLSTDLYHGKNFPRSKNVCMVFWLSIAKEQFCLAMYVLKLNVTNKKKSVMSRQTVWMCNLQSWIENGYHPCLQNQGCESGTQWPLLDLESEARFSVSKLQMHVRDSSKPLQKFYYTRMGRTKWNHKINIV